MNTQLLICSIYMPVQLLNLEIKLYIYFFFLRVCHPKPKVLAPPLVHVILKVIAKHSYIYYNAKSSHEVKAPIDEARYIRSNFNCAWHHSLSCCLVFHYIN